MQRWFVNRPADNGCVYYRHTLPVRHLTRVLTGSQVRVTYSRYLDITRSYDVYIFGRVVGPEYISVLLDFKSRGKKIVWDLDDDLFDLSRHPKKDRHAAAMEVRCLQTCLNLADLITVSTAELGRVVGRTDKTAVCPNMIDLRDNPLRQPTNDGPLLYTGSPSHRHDAELLRDLHDQTHREFQWVFHGVKPDYLTSRDVYIPWSRVSDYPRVCRLIRPRVAFAPLTAEPFNNSKSPIKIWECAALGASVLATNFGPYAGSAAGIVPPGESFKREHLDHVLNNPNVETCAQEAISNSWQYSRDGVWAWTDAYDSIRVFHEQETPCESFPLPH